MADNGGLVNLTAVEALEGQERELKTLLEQRNAAIRLANNRDFKKIILDGFMVTEAARHVRESGDPALGAEMRADALAMGQAAGHLKRYLSQLIQQGAHAERTIQEVQAELEEARVEEGAEAVSDEPTGEEQED